MTSEFLVFSKFIYAIQSTAKKILEKSNIMPAPEFEKFSQAAAKSGKTAENYLIEKKIITANSLYENAAG